MSKFSELKHETNIDFDRLLNDAEHGKLKKNLSSFFTRPAYKGTSMETRTVFKEDKCKACAYYQEPDIIGDKECCFPWFDPQEYDEAVFDYLPCQEDKDENE